jgi:hypothetical protein
MTFIIKEILRWPRTIFVDLTEKIFIAMKRYILLTLSFVVVFGAFAQITLNPKVLNVQGPNSGERTATAAITNNSSDPTDKEFTWTLINFSKPMGWQIDLCDPFNCYNNITSSTSQTFTLNQGATNIVKADFFFNNINGNGSFGVVIKSTKNASNADTVIMNGTAWVTSVNEVSKAKTVSFYPNPVRDQLTLKFPVKDGVNVDIYNVLGMKVKTFAHNSSVTSVNIGDLQNGVYFIRFSENGVLYTKQFTKAE